MNLRPGSKLHSAVCETQVVVVRAPADDVEITCGGVPMLGDGEETTAGAELAPSEADGSLMGKRYAEESLGLELLCTRPGNGTLACNGTVLPIKGAKPLPASD
jgi:hypothetical protein